ncbi:MAG: diguanylate cyclase [Algicola sp.]|nr:diguanylate cyclase [Algicola sp.]
MKHCLKRFSALLLLLASCSWAVAEPLVIVIDGRFTDVQVGQYIEYLAVDSAHVNSSVLPTTAENWQIYQKHTITLGPTDATYWFRFTLSNQTDIEQRLLLEVQNPSLDVVEIHQVIVDGMASGHRVGDLMPFAQRPIAHEQLLLPLAVAARQDNTVYLKVSNNGLFDLPIHLWQPHAYIEHSSKSTLTSALLLGFLGAIIFSALLLFLVSRNRKFMLFSTTLITQCLALVTLYGFGNRFVWPQWAWLQQHIVSLLITLSLVAGALFGIALLNLRKHNIRLLQLVRGLVATGLGMMLVNLFIPVYLSIVILLIYAVVLSVSLLVVGIWCSRQNINSARLYTAAWAVTAVSFVYVTSWAAMKLDMSVATLDVFVFNILISTVLLFIALIKQYTDEKTAQVAEQQRAIIEIKNHEAMQEQMLKVEEQSREALEVKIQERTFELEVTLRELEEINRELEEKNTQDALTGMRNRRFFDKKYLAEFRRSRREQTQLSLLMLDIDYFKRVNDNHGHLAGDDVIRFVGRTVSDILKRPMDDACRYGGEEFALILPSTSAEGAIGLGETIREKLAAATIETEAGPINITVSCGVFTGICHVDMSKNHYIERADKALYRAKETGRNKVVHHRDVEAADDTADAVKD